MADRGFSSVPGLGDLLGMAGNANVVSAVTKSVSADATQVPVVALIKADSTGILYAYCSGTLVAPQFVEAAP